MPDSGAERELQTWLEQKQAEARLQSVILEQSACSGVVQRLAALVYAAITLSG